MEAVSVRLAEGYLEFSRNIESLLESPPVLIGEANPPLTSGVYALIFDSEVVYVGEAKGASGLRDRILSKHVSGDDNHAVQRALKARFPDRHERRDFIRQAVGVQWIEIADPNECAVVERLLIWLLKPKWNAT